MINISSLISGDKASTPLVTWLSRLLDNIGHRLHADGDTEARQHGWQITQSHGRLARHYRDPRFDFLARCPACAGTGRPDGTRCEPCDGTGRVTLRQSDLAQGGAGHA